MKRIIAGMAAALLAAISYFSIQASAISAQSYILLDGTTGRVLEQSNADDRSLIASTTKIMTALIICEQCNVLDRVRIPKQAVGVEGSSMYLQEDEILTVQELLYGLMLRSGNDAAVALAVYCAGTVDDFAQLMNDKAHRLGLNNTHFANPHGLDAPDHYSSARDLATLTAYAMNNPLFAQIVSTRAVNIGNRSLRNHNKLLWQVPDVDGVKTGYTKAAGRILVSSAKRQGRRLICVTINDANDWHDHQSLLESGFSNYTMRTVVSAGQSVGTIEVAGGAAMHVQLLADEDFMFSFADGEEPTLYLPPSGFVYAPVAEGQHAGFANVCLDGILIGKVPLVFGQTIEQKKENNRTLWERIMKGDAA